MNKNAVFVVISVVAFVALSVAFSHALKAIGVMTDGYGCSNYGRFTDEDCGMKSTDIMVWAEVLSGFLAWRIYAALANEITAKARVIFRYWVVATGALVVLLSILDKMLAPGTAYNIASLALQGGILYFIIYKKLTPLLENIRKETR